MRQWQRLCGLAALLSGPAAAGPPAPPPEIANIPVILALDVGSGQMLYSRKADLRFVPASMTKVMTAYVAFEEMSAGRLREDSSFIVPTQVSREWKGKGTSMFLEAGDKVTGGQLLHAIMTGSANDAAVVLAHGHAGSLSAWSEMMNDAARRIGMRNSRFKSPNGWPDGGKTFVTARDLATLSQAMIRRFPLFYRSYSGQTAMVWRGRTLRNHDPLLGVVAGADGIKTGYTREAGFNFVGSGERAGRRIVIVVAGAKSEEQRAEAARALLEWGFSAWRSRPLFHKGEIVAFARVQQGDAQRVALVAPGDIHASVPRTGSAPIALRLIYRGPLRAPLAKGAEVAELEISVDGMAPGRIPLRTAATVGKASLMDRLWNGLMNLFA